MEGGYYHARMKRSPARVICGRRCPSHHQCGGRCELKAYHTEECEHKHGGHFHHDGEWLPTHAFATEGAAFEGEGKNVLKSISLAPA